MALKTSLSLLSERISKAVHAAVRKHGLTRSDYRLFGTFESESDHISLALKTTRQIDELELYSDVFSEIRRLFPDDPSLPMHVGLVIRSAVSSGEMNSFALWVESQEDITHLLDRG
jgi:transposase-like protein